MFLIDNMPRAWPCKRQILLDYSDFWITLILCCRHSSARMFSLMSYPAQGEWWAPEWKVSKSRSIRLMWKFYGRLVRTINISVFLLQLYFSLLLKGKHPKIAFFLLVISVVFFWQINILKIILIVISVLKEILLWRTISPQRIGIHEHMSNRIEIESC